MEIEKNIELLENGNLLTQTEKEVFEMVYSRCNDFNPPVVARAAGGWVRDKLLGKESDDIDIAVENTTGLAFAENLKYKIKNDNIKIVVIEANPDQSKHLETARVCIFPDFWIDFCGLRSDSYTQDSRIPSIKQGTPMEDAKRRDFRMNALFFNINTKKVEDFTNGIEDLKNGIINTPLDPIESFKDDPLRVLRAFRFASRFGFKLHESIIPAAQKIHGDFKRKITRERIATELIKAFDGIAPLDTLIYLVESGLFSPVFDRLDEWSLDPNEALKRVQTVVSRHPGNDRFLVLSLSAIYSPILSNPKVSDPERNHKKINAIEYAIARNLKMPVKVAYDVESILTGAYELVKLEKNLTRLNVGRWIRHIGELWKFSSLVVFDDDIYNFYINVVDPFIKEQRLEDVWEMKPLMNGVELANLHGIKPGKELKPLIEKLIDWQLENPFGTAEEYIEYVNNQKNK
ncbi:polyA polymerase family protein [Histomonas meleagridis]|uniref:polyA polymerase family protein n=1 Tax=Histomonas meleagridis TaxID=135588 RepID=UPI00355A98AA|nr:polyA polymerase family protein [Histomonas meleagridis]KAH0805725.1 polyA polymerase family protein [Histomonas meleagridis]